MLIALFLGWAISYYLCHMAFNLFNLPTTDPEFLVVVVVVMLVYWLYVKIFSENPYFYKSFFALDFIIQSCGIIYLDSTFGLFEEKWVIWIPLIISLFVYLIRNGCFECNYIQRHKFPPVSVRAFIKSWFIFFDFLMIFVTVNFINEKTINLFVLCLLAVLWLLMSIGIAIFSHHKIIVFMPIFPHNWKKRIRKIISHPDMLHNRSTNNDKIRAIFHSSQIEYDFFLHQVVNKINLSRGKKLSSVLTSGFSNYYIFDDGTLLYCRINDGHNVVEGGKYETFIFGSEIEHSIFKKKNDFANYVNELGRQHDQDLPPYNPKEKSQIILGPCAIVNRKDVHVCGDAFISALMLDHNEYLKWEAARRNITTSELRKEHKKIWYYYRHLYLSEVEEMLRDLVDLCSNEVEDEEEDYERRKIYAETALEEVFETTETWRGSRLESSYTESIGYRYGKSGPIYHSKYEAKESIIQTEHHNNLVYNYSKQRDLSIEMLVNTTTTLNRELQEMRDLGLYPKVK